MSQKVTYLAGSTPLGELVSKEADVPIGPLDVVLRITHSGLCGTDGHDRTAGCGLGHEGVGIVERIGGAVTKLKVGDRAGCSWQTNSCGTCRECLAGYCQCCPQSVGQKYGQEEGTFADYAVRHQDFVYPIPDAIESKHAGPLLCAGITVFEALRVANTKPGDKVGVIGLGGLGHLAVLYARAIGCEVAVLSGSEAKRADAEALGATEFHVLDTESQSSGSGAQVGVDVMLHCGGSLSDFTCIIPYLRRRARIVLLVIQAQPLVIPYLPLLLAGHQIIGCTSATRENMMEALRFAAIHQIKPLVQEFPMSLDGLRRAFVELDSGTLRFRAVLSAESIG